MGLPSQLISESKKDKEWKKNCVLSIWQMISTTSWTKEKDRFCYNFFHGILNEGDYNYLTKVDNYEYPAKLRYIPLIRPQQEFLKSEETQRPLNFRVFTIDQLSLKKKEDEILEQIFAAGRANLMARYLAIQENINKLNQQTQIEGQQAQEAGKGFSPSMDSLVAIDGLNYNSYLAKKDIEKVEKYIKYEHRDLVELIMDKGLDYMIERYHIKDKFTQGFEDQLIVDKEIYFVDWTGYDEDPEFRKCETLNIYHSGDDEAEWIDECEWVAEERWMSIPQIIDSFKGRIKGDDLEKLNSKAKYFAAVQNGYTGYTDRYMIDNSTDSCNVNALYSGTEDYGNKLKVLFCYWKSPRELNFKKTPNKYISDLEHTHLMKDGDSVNEAKKEYIEQRYCNDIYMGICIDQDIFLNLEKKPIQLRSVDRPGEVNFPYIGPAYNGNTRRPYSLTWATREIQMLYNIIHYHKELWLALSGVKGFIMDKSQVPDNMSMKEWLYQRKLGIGWIQTVKEGRVNASFNQFQSFDDTISPSIRLLVDLLSHLEELARNITGVSRQRMASIEPGDRVGNTEASINQSSIITEMLYYKHDKVKKRALSRLANLCAKAWKKGKRAQYITGMFAQQMLNIPEGSLDNVDLEVFVGDALKDQRAMNELRQVAFQDHSKNLFSLAQVAKLYSVSSLKEMEVTLEKYGELAEEKASNGAKNNQDFEIKKIQMELDLKKLVESQRDQLGQMKLQLEKLKNDTAIQEFQTKGQLEKYKVDKQDETKRIDIESEKQIELLYLKEQKLQDDKHLELENSALELEATGVLINTKQQNDQHKERMVQMKKPTVKK